MTVPLELPRLRQGLYRYFGGALLPPDEQKVAAVAAASEFLDDAGIERFAFYGSWKRFARMAASVSAASLSGSYVRLFASGVDGALCPPIESFYRAEAKGGSVARLVSQIEQVYGEMGLSASGASDLPDHAATELEAMSVLCGREAGAREAGKADRAAAALLAQHRFLRGHLAVWFPVFRARVVRIEAADTFYASLVEAAHAFVVHDADLVPVLLREVEGAAA